MTKPRRVNDGLPHRLYERKGLKTYSIAYKRKDGTWAFRLSCAIGNEVQKTKLRRDAIRRALSQTTSGHQIETVKQLIDDWFDWQKNLPEKSTRKRKVSTMTENRREADNLTDVFGEMAIADIKAHHGYSYLDKCDQLGRGPKGNKEIALCQLIFQRAVRLGILDANPLRDIDKLPTAPSTRYVEDDELALALEVGKEIGGSTHLAAIALRVAGLCVRRSTETLDLRYADLLPEGIRWLNKKKKATDFERVVIISWSDELRTAIETARTIRGKINDEQSEFVFGTTAGTRYTKGGWKKTLDRLMEACQARAEARGMTFARFNLQDQRPKGITDKIAGGHTDTQDATLHKSKRMIDGVYDRLRKRTAQPAG